MAKKKFTLTSDLVQLEAGEGGTQTLPIEQKQQAEPESPVSKKSPET